MLVHLILSQRSLHLSLFLFILLSLFCSALVIFTFLSPNSLIHPSRVFFILVVVLFITDCFFFFTSSSAVAAKSLQSCPPLCDPIDGSPPGSPVPGILQARTLERVVISFSNAWKWKMKVKSLSRVRPLATPWTAAFQAPPSLGFARQEYWSGVPLPSLLRKYSRDLITLSSNIQFTVWEWLAEMPLCQKPKQ